MRYGFLVVILFGLLLSLIPQILYAQDVKISVATKEIKSPITLTAEQKRAMDLKVAKVIVQPMTTFLPINSEVQLLPNQQADVSIRINGQVIAIYANLGDRVNKGQPLVKVQSRLVGNPPPSVVINATMSGIVDVRNVKQGQSVSPNDILFHISNRDHVNVVGQVYEEDVGKVKLGQTAIIRALSYPQKNFGGTVTFIDPTLDPLTRTVKIWILVANSQGLLKPNMFAKAYIILKRDPAAITVPTLALLEDNGKTFVFVKEGDQYRRVILKIGTADEERTEVLSGLTRNDSIVIQGQRQLYAFWLSGGQRSATMGEGH